MNDRRSFMMVHLSRTPLSTQWKMTSCPGHAISMFFVMDPALRTKPICNAIASYSIGIILQLPDTILDPATSQTATATIADIF